MALGESGRADPPDWEPPACAALRAGPGARQRRAGGGVTAGSCGGGSVGREPAGRGREGKWGKCSFGAEGQPWLLSALLASGFGVEQKGLGVPR